MKIATRIATRIAIAPLLLLLAACSAPPAPVAPQATTPPPAAAAKRVAGSESVDPLWIFRAFGTEPFWNARVEGRTLTYTTPENPTGIAMQGERRAIEGGVELGGRHEGRDFVLTVVAGDCSDGMSDNRYALVATFRYGEAEYRGCAEAAR